MVPRNGLKSQDVISSCLPCQTVAQPNRPEPLQVTDTPEKPWSELAIDYYEPIPQTGQYLMVLIDKYSKYPEVEIVNSTDAKSCIPKLDKIFATHGIPDKMPDKMTSDNGPPFTANERQSWTDSHDYYFEYLIIHFDYLIIQFDYLIIG